MLSSTTNVRADWSILEEIRASSVATKIRHGDTTLPRRVCSKHGTLWWAIDNFMMCFVLYTPTIYCQKSLNCRKKSDATKKYQMYVDTPLEPQQQSVPVWGQNTLNLNDVSPKASTQHQYQHQSASPPRPQSCMSPTNPSPQIISMKIMVHRPTDWDRTAKSHSNLQAPTPSTDLFGGLNIYAYSSTRMYVKIKMSYFHPLAGVIRMEETLASSVVSK